MATSTRQPEPPSPPQDGATAPPMKDRSHYLYIGVIVAVVLGVVVGAVSPELGISLKVLGTSFVDLIKMMISPVIFCTIVLGIGSVPPASARSAVWHSRPAWARCATSPC